MAPDIFGQRIDDDVRTLVERALPQRAEEGVVDRDRAVELRRVYQCADRFDVDQRIGRVTRAFEIDHADLAALFVGLGLRLLEHCIDLFACGAGGEVDIGHAELGEHLGHEAFGGRIKRARVDDHVVLAGIGKHQHADRGHPAGKAQCILCAIPNRQAILEDFLIGRVEARIDETVRAARALAGDAFEMALAIGGAGKGKGRGQEDRRLETALGEHRIIAMAHHQRAGFEFAPGNLGNFGLGCHARAGRVDIVVAHRASLLPEFALPGRREPSRANRGSRS